MQSRPRKQFDSANAVSRWETRTARAPARSDATGGIIIGFRVIRQADSRTRTQFLRISQPRQIWRFETELAEPARTAPAAG
jgi:hypothetical protein